MSIIVAAAVSRPVAAAVMSATVLAGVLVDVSGAPASAETISSALARAYGWWASERVDVTAAFEPALRAALDCGRPALIHLRLDADVITSRTTLAAIRASALQKGR